MTITQLCGVISTNPGPNRFLNQPPTGPKLVTVSSAIQSVPGSLARSATRSWNAGVWVGAALALVQQHRGAVGEEGSRCGTRPVPAVWSGCPVIREPVGAGSSGTVASRG